MEICDLEEPLPVCIIHWNRPDDCIGALDSFNLQRVHVQLTVVDNGSPEAAVCRIARHAPSVRVIRLARNVGFGAAANVGLNYMLKSSVAEFIAVAAHDAIPERDCLVRLVAEMKRHPRAGIASADYGSPPRQHFSWIHGVYLKPRVEPTSEWQPALFPCGTLMMFRRACLEEIGIFDERFFAYGEEQDIGFRARASGWEVGVVAGAVVHNPIRAASGAVAYYLTLRNSLLLVYKYGGWVGVCVRTGAMLVNMLVLMFFKKRRIDGHSTWIRLRAIADFWRGRMGPPPDTFSISRSTNGNLLSPTGSR